MAEDGENNEQLNDENRVDPDEDRKKSLAIIQQGLSQLSKTADNTSYALINLNIEEKELANLYDIIENLTHLRYANIVNNKIIELNQFNNLQSLLVLNATKNEITSLDCFIENKGLQFLQFLNVSQNKIKALTHLNLPRLRRLILQENEIVTCEEFKGSKTLEFIDISKNKLKNLNGIQNLPKLTELVASENEINNMMDLKDVPNLQKLNIRQNQMDKLQFGRLPKLFELNVEANKITSFKEFESLKSLPALTSVLAKENPCCDEVGDASKRQILMQLSYLKMIHGEVITAEDMEEMIKEREEKKLAEEERLREEAIKREEERIEREKLEKEQEEIKRKEREEQEKIEEQQREEQRKIQEEQDRIAEEERLKKEEEEKQLEAERLKAEEEQKKLEEEERLKAEEEERLKKEEEEKLKAQEEEKQKEETEQQKEETEQQKEEDLEEQKRQKLAKKAEYLSSISERLPKQFKMIKQMFDEVDDDTTNDKQLTIDEARFNVEKFLGVTDSFEIKTPILVAFMYSKNKTYDQYNPDDNEDKVNIGEFKLFIQYLKKYLHFMAIFVQIDYNDNHSVSQEEFLKYSDKILDNIQIDDKEAFFEGLPKNEKGEVLFNHLASSLFRLEISQATEED